MVSDVPFGVLLSGGVDSSLNVALMSELMTRPVTTFTIGYEGKEDYNEFQFARRVSQRYKTDHHETLINREGDAGLPAAARPAAGRADRRQRLHPALLPRASWSRTAARPSCRSARAPTRTSSATGGASTTGRSTSRSISRRGSAAVVAARRGGARASRAPRCQRRRRSRCSSAREPRRGAVLGRRGLLVGRDARRG